MAEGLTVAEAEAEGLTVAEAAAEAAAPTVEEAPPERHEWQILMTEVASTPPALEKAPPGWDDGQELLAEAAPTGRWRPHVLGDVACL